MVVTGTRIVEATGVWLVTLLGKEDSSSLKVSVNARGVAL